MADPTFERSLAALRWLIEAGADEAIAEEPVNRFAPKHPSPREGESVPSPPRTAFVRPTLPQGEGGKRAAASAEAVSLGTGPGAARALASSCATLDELKHALRNFEGCELKRYAKNTVFADGTPQGRIMLIGEAPGRDEDEQGLPFVGRAGKLLDRMLGAIGLDRGKVYITNVLNWRPPQNRDPSPEEAAACLPFLHRHIELADPQILILLGAVSARHVLGLTDGIMRLRGRWELYQSAHLGRAIPVMPTLHPAFLLRQPGAKRLAWRDLLAISEKIEQLGLA
ncbi:MAG TPA: uracil-DNA glycosylase [Micropepsaceae bacterium]|jgi:DNA polymerase|nr:uracil-DNA glycosylase [Micropepsaceae bacterium]